MRLLVFGTGEYYQRFKKWLAKEAIAALIDNSPVKQHTIMDGHEVLSPQEGLAKEYDAVIIMSFHVKAMKKQLIELGADEENIYHFYDLRRLVTLNKQDIAYYGIPGREPGDDGEKRIALLSTDLALGGTAIALFQMARALKKRGYPVLLASMMDGPLRKQAELYGIPVVIDPNLQLATMRETEWVSGFSLILCNSVGYYIFLTERNLKIPVIWWLHDSSFFYDGVDKEMLRRIPQENLTVLSVGPVPEQVIHETVPELAVGQLLYGVEDCAGSEERKEICRQEEAKKTCFVTVGHIEERKGQDILLRAVRMLDESAREKAVFYLVGQDTSLLAERLKEQAGDLPGVTVTGPVDREELGRILSRADVMVCPSREDPMPTVAAEAMMYGVPCILSDAVGTAAYIQDGDGLVFESGNAQELSAKIKWCVEHRDRLGQMGKNARRIYERHFSMDVFEENLARVIGAFM